MTQRIRRVLAIGIVAVMALGGVMPAFAQGREFLGGFRDWDAFLERKGKGEKTCYMISVPKDTAPKNVNRGEIYLIVTHWPQAKIQSQINVVVGYPLKKDSEVTMIIDNKPYRMFTDGDRAWAYDAKQDLEMAAAMKKGSSVVVKGVSQRGTETTDRYSLAGFTAAHNAITQSCNN